MKKIKLLFLIFLALLCDTTIFSQSIDYWRQEAEKGNAEAQDRYAECLRRGNGVKKDYAEAVRWYEKAIKQNNINAVYHMGICYEYGQGVPQNYKKAISYYTYAAQYGIKDAEESLNDFKLEAVSKSHSWGFMFHDQVVIPFDYDSIGSEYFVSDVMPVKKRNGWGLINKEGRTVIPCEYDDISVFFPNGLAVVKKNGKYGYIDKKNKIVIPVVYELTWGFFNDLAAVQKNGKWGLIDESNNTIIPFMYDEPFSFSEDMAAVKKNGKWGFIDKNNKTVIPFEYDGAESFKKGNAIVKKGKSWGEIDKYNNIVTPFEYEYNDLYWGRKEQEVHQEIIQWEEFAVDETEEFAVDEKTIVDVPDTDPEFPGGTDALYQFLAENIKYPQIARDNGIHGKVYITFVVERDGSITDIKVLRDIGGGCGAEAVRVAKSMPKWKPGKKDGQTVRVRFNLPVNFDLNKDTK